MYWDKKLNKWVIMALVIAVVYYFFIYHPYTGPSELPEPVQTPIEAQRITYYGKDARLIEMSLLATYKVYAGIKGVQKYSTDGASSVSPVDFILAWGSLNNPVMNKAIHYTQSQRWFYFRYKNDENLNLDPIYIGQHASNTHIIPQNEAIEKLIKKVRKNDYVLLEGYLVNVHFGSGDWSSSMTRNDEGDGACEILYVTSIEIY